MKPTIAQKCPFAVPVIEGQTYYWCSCGLSKKQPFCDGGHQGTEFKTYTLSGDRNEDGSFLWM